MLYLDLANNILHKIKETEDLYSLIIIEHIYYDNIKSLFLIFNYQLIQKNRNIKYNIYIEDINNIIEIDRKVNQLINKISIKNQIRIINNR